MTPELADNGTTRGDLTGRDLFEGETAFGVHGIPDHAVGIRHLLDRHAPGFGSALAHLAFDLLGGRIGGPARLEGHATAPGDGRKAHGIRVPHFRMDLLEGDTQGLGHLLRDRSPGAADIR